MFVRGFRLDWEAVPFIIFVLLYGNRLARRALPAPDSDDAVLL